MDYGVVHESEVSRTDMSDMMVVAPEVKAVDVALDVAEDVRYKIWYYGPGDETQHHSHDLQEEVFYVLEGEFVVTLEDDGEVERFELEPGSFYAAGKGVRHGHRYVGEDEGAVLAIGAPAVDDVPDDWTPLDEM